MIRETGTTSYRYVGLPEKLGTTHRIHTEQSQFNF